MSTRIGDYRANRRQAVEALNAEYRAAFASLIGRYDDLSRDRLTLQQRADARAGADRILLNWKRETAFSLLAVSLKETRGRQLAAIDERAAALAKMRKEYAESYADIQLELKKLDTAQKSLAELAEPEDSRQATLRLLVEIGKLAQQAREAAAQAPPKQEPTS